MAFANEPAIYLDVSQMLGNRLQTGIQRVVRQLARVGPQVAAEFHRHCRLVHSIGSQFYRLRYEHIDIQHPHPLFKIAQRRVGRRLLHKMIPLTSRPVEPQAGDILITLNATWDSPGWSQAVAGFAETGYVTSVVYDLTPLTHPQFHTPELSQRFATWIGELAAISHRWIAISRHVAGELEKYLNHRAIDAGQRPSVSFFRLGSDFPDNLSRNGAVPAEAHARVRPTLSSYLASNRPTVLLVGTIEPRKNQVAAFEACRRLWNEGWPGQLLLLGRVGWKSDPVLERLAKLPPERVLWLSDATDQELDYAYRHSTLLLFPSWEEGFGLPIVEALQRGTPVMASRHPVHYEVGGEACQYFAPDAPQELAHLIASEHRGGYSSSRRLVENFSPLDWHQSCRHLVADVILAARQAGPRKPSLASLPQVA